MKRSYGSIAFAVSLAAFALAGIGCSGGGGVGGGGSQTGPPPPIVVTRTFPKGDAIPQGGGTAWDIVAVTKTLTGQFGGANGNTYDTLRVDITFAQDVSNALPAPGQPLKDGSQLGVSVGIDSDGNPATGSFSGCPSENGTPYEYVSDVGYGARLSDGNYSILRYGGNPIYSGPPSPGSEAQTTVAGNELSQTFFLVTIAATTGAAIPNVRVNVAAVNGSSATLPTDCVPINGTDI